MGRLSIRYREFYDVPRIFLVELSRGTLLFDCQFDDESDEYATTYVVYQVPAIPVSELEGSWLEIRRFATARLGTVPVSAVQFDETRRKSIDDAVLALIPGISG